MSFIQYTDPADAAKGMVSETAINSTGDEFLDVLTRALRDAEGRAEKASVVAQKADDDRCRAVERLNAIRSAVEAYREASAHRLKRAADDGVSECGCA